MKIQKLNSLLIFLMTFSGFFGISSVFLAKENETCAVIEKDFLSASACVPNYAVCEAGFRNLGQMLDSGDFKVSGVSRADVRTAFRDYYEPEDGSTPIPVNDLCINEGIDTFISNFVGTSTDYEINRDYEGFAVDSSFFGNRTGRGLDGVTTIVRACPPNWSASQAQNENILLWVGGNPWGCCPQGFTFVNEREASSISEFQQGVCCRTPRGVSGRPAYLDGNPGAACITANEESIPHDGPSASTYEELTNIVISGDYYNFYQLTGGPNNGKFPSLGINIAGRYYLGKNEGGIVRIAEGNRVGAEKKCSDEYANTGCAALSDNQTIVDPLVFTEAGNTDECAGCFGRSEPIALVNNVLANGDVESRQLEMCTGIGGRGEFPEGRDSGSDVSVLLDLVNGNINDTIAYYAADEANRGTLLTCRERGGIYTAIGCIDPTPLGVLTGLIRIAFGVTGGVALVQLILAGIAYQSGEEERIREARQKVFATIGGLGVLVFSVVILRIIGVNVLDVLPIGAI